MLLVSGGILVGFLYGFLGGFSFVCSLENSRTDFINNDRITLNINKKIMEITSKNKLDTLEGIFIQA